MDFEVMKAYLPRFWDALLLTLRIGWQGVALALALGVADSGHGADNLISCI